MISWIKSKLKGDSKMTTQNLTTLKANLEKAQNDFNKELARIQAQLPEGVTLVLEGQPSEVLQDITDKRTIRVGDVIRCMSPLTYLTEGRDYTVTRIDSSGDPQIRDDVNDEYDTHCNLSRFKKVVKSPVASTAQPQWMPLTRTSRDNLEVGDYVRVVDSGNCYDDITLNKEYRVHAKPDRDGRFRDDANDSRDTLGWTMGEGYTHQMEYRKG